MIKLTRLDGEGFVLNAELIKYVESRPDTFITLTTGDRVVAREAVDEVLARVLEYQQTKQLLPAASRPRNPPHPDGLGLADATPDPDGLGLAGDRSLTAKS